MKLRWKIALGFLAVVLLAVLWLVLAHYRAKARWEAYRQQLRALGEPLTLDEFKWPPLEDGMNGAADLMGIVPRMHMVEYTNQPTLMKCVDFGKARVSWQQAELAEGRSSNVWPAVKADFDDNPEALVQVREILEKPAIRLRLDFRQGPYLLLPHLWPLRRLDRHLAAAASLALHEGRPVDAWRNLRALTQLQQHWGKDEPLLISQLFRYDLEADAVTTTWEVMQSPALTEPEWAELQSAWQSLDYSHDAGAALSMAHVMSALTYMRLREDPAKVKDALHDFGSSSSGGPAYSSEDPIELLKKMANVAGASPKFMAWACWQSYDDEIWHAQAIRDKSFVVRRFQATSNWAAANREYQKMRAQAGECPEAYLLSQTGFTLWQNPEVKLARAEAMRNLVMAAIALKRYEIRHHRYPSALAGLVPEFVAAVPVDCMNGQPLRYRVLPDGQFLLWSVGEDGVDDGGNPESVDKVKRSHVDWLNGRDWVWPSRATPEEVEQYDAKMKERSK